MLYEFHRVQNGKKPGSVHATYLVAGKKHAEEAPKVARSTKDCGDEYMRSSPFRSSPVPRLGELLENSSVLSITLIREEDLEGTLYTKHI
jgi:DNA polymerase delta subunit 3